SRYNVGFTAQLEEVEKLIRDVNVNEDTNNKIVFVEGHHWHGTTHFARELMHRLRKFVYIVAASAIKFEEAQLVVWQALMARITRECHLLTGDKEGYKKSIIRFLEDTGKTDLAASEKIWLANDLLGTDWKQPNLLIEEIREEVRMDYLVKLILHFLRVVSQYAPLLLVIVKHEFMSRQDWFITHMVCKK
ncbi:hypothetical protein RFI_19204, partial [Reticulomyxa filosa]